MVPTNLSKPHVRLKCRTELNPKDAPKHVPDQPQPFQRVVGPECNGEADALMIIKLAP